MKKIILGVLFLFLAIITFSSFENGISSAYNRTGANGSQGSCSDTSINCHNSSVPSNLILSIVLTDNQGGIVNNFKYTPSAFYRITLKGALASGGSFSEFGFQFTTGQYFDGDFTLTNAYQKSVVVNSIEYIEHAMPIPASNNTFETYFFWQAPPPGTGSVTFHGTMLAANGDHTGNGDISANSYITFQEGISATAVNNLSEHATVTLYPNPVKDQLNMNVTTKEYGTYTVNVFNLSGQKIYQQQANIQSSNHQLQINTSSWSKGLYLLTVQKGESAETFRVMK